MTNMALTTTRTTDRSGKSAKPAPRVKNNMTPHKALQMVERFLHAKSLLVIHGLMSDSERDRVNVRIDKWAIQHGLKRAAGKEGG